MPADPFLPTEDDEQETVVQWLELQGLKFTAIPNHTYTTSWKQKNHNKRIGLRAGLCDLLVLVPPARSTTGAGFALFIEMKRRKASYPTQAQKDWIEAINGLDTPSVTAHVANGADAALDILKRYVRVRSTPVQF